MIIRVLNETPIGRALRLYWDDMHLWVFANICLIFSLIPAYILWTIGKLEIALVASFPAVFVIAGIASMMSKAVIQGAPHCSTLRQAPYRIAFSGWAALMVAAQLFALPGLVVQSLLAVTTLLIAPMVIYLPSLYPAGLRATWRNAIVIAIHAPMFALGMACLALLFAWLVVISRGALLLALPTLWLAVALVSLREVVESMDVK
jgi:hypothetical protein